MVARLLQSVAVVHSGMQLGYSPPKPDAQEPQSAEAENWLGHEAHVGPVHELRHWHVQPVRDVPVTCAARLLQSAAMLHWRKQLGYPSNPATHCAQSRVASMLVGHVWQEEPVHELRHVHWQPLDVVPLTAVARPLQWVAFVHVTAQRG